MATIEEVRCDGRKRHYKTPEGTLWRRLSLVGMVVWLVLGCAVVAAMAVAYEDESDYQVVGANGTEVVVSRPLPAKLIMNGEDVTADLSPIEPGPRIPRCLIAGEGLVVALTFVGLVIIPDRTYAHKRERYIDDLIAAWARNGDELPPEADDTEDEVA